MDVNSLGRDNENYIDMVKQLAEGYIGAATAANVAIVNGEIAELGNRINGFGKFNWGAAVVWFANKKRLITGKEVKVGDSLVGLRETGFRSNGISLVRKIMEENYGSEWHNLIYEGKKLGELALEPSKIYTSAIVDMFGGFMGDPKVTIHGIAHVTGGGIPGKLERALRPSGYGAVISDPYTPSELMLYCQEKGNVSDEEAYKTWNMGVGMIVITPEPDKVISIAKEYNHEAKVIGEVKSKPGIKILSRGFYSKGNNHLTFK